MEVSGFVQVDQETVYSGAAARDDYKDMPELRENFFPSGGRPILAGLLPGMQAEGP
jgi:hypothetical protein